MANPEIFSLIKPNFFVPLLPGFDLHLSIPVTFFRKHIEGRHENKTATLNSDTSHRSCNVKLDGRRFTEGWRDFADDHDFRVGDFVVFRHEGDLVFHVTGFGPSFCNLQYAPFRPEDDDREDNNIRNVSIVKTTERILKTEAKFELVRNVSTPLLCLFPTEEGSKAKTEKIHSERRSSRMLLTESSAGPNRFLTLTLKPDNLRRGNMRLPIPFTRGNGIHKPGTMTLLDKHGVEWLCNFWLDKSSEAMRLGKGSRGFFGANGVKAGDSFTLELIWRDSTTPVLKFCSMMQRDSKSMKPGTIANAEDRPEEAQWQKMEDDKSLIRNKPQTRKRVRVGEPILDPSREKRSKHQEKGPTGDTSARGVEENSESDEVAEAKQKIHDALNTLGQFPEVLTKEELNLLASLRKLDAFGNLSGKRKAKLVPKAEAESSTDQSCFMVPVTASNLRTDTLSLPIGFMRSNGLNKSCCEIVLMDDRGRSWTLDLRHKKLSGQVYIRRGWRSFCQENGLQARDSCVFKLVRNGTNPVFRLSPTECSSRREESLEADKEKCYYSTEERSEAKVEETHFGNRSGKENSSSHKCTKRKENEIRSRRRVSSSLRPNRFVTLTLTPKNNRDGSVRLPKLFTRDNGIDNSGTMILLDKNGVEWPTNYYREKKSGRMYLGKGWRGYFEANGVKEGESLTLELIRTDTTPKLKFCSKIGSDAESAEHQPEEAQQKNIAAAKSLRQKDIQTRKRVRVGGPVLVSAREKRSKQQENGPIGASSERGAAVKSRCTQSFSASELPEVLVKEEQSQGTSLHKFNAFGEHLRKKRVDKNPETEAGSSEDHSCFVARVTAANLREDKLYLPIKFARANGLTDRCCDILLMNEQGRSWTSSLKDKKHYNRTFISGGWRNFCRANGQKAGSIFTLKHVREGTKLALQMSSTVSNGNSIPGTCSLKPESQEKSSKRKEETHIMQRASSSPCQSPFLVLTPTPHSVGSWKQRLPVQFTRENGIKKPGEIILVDKDGVKWPIRLMKETDRGQMSLGRGWRDFCTANDVEGNKSLVFELIWEEDNTTPVLKFCPNSKVM